MRYARSCLLRGILIVLGCLPSAARAAYLSIDTELPLEIHAFASPGFIFTTNDNNYLAESSSSGSFEFTEVGFNVTKHLTDKLRFGLQLFARQLGPLGDYKASADWYYLDYRWTDWLGVRAGRVKIPFGLYNDISEIDSARVPVLLPQSVYPIQDLDYLLAQTGVELYGYVDFGAGGALDYRAWAGTIFIDSSNPSSTLSPVQLENLDTRYIVGGRLMWETPLQGLRVGGTLQALRLDSTLLYTLPPAPTQVSMQTPVVLGVASLEYSVDDLLLAAEYSRWHVTIDSSNKVLLPEVTTDYEGAYVMASYRVASWFQPGMYYSTMFPNTAVRTGRANQQHDVAATLRFDMNTFWLVKLEGHYMNGTAALEPSLNDNKPLTALSNNWAAFFAKSSVYF